DLGYGTGSRKRELQVLGLARCAGRGRASVRDLRVRRESGGISDGQLCPANSPFNGTRDVPMTGETHPASFSVPDNQVAGHRRHDSLRHPLTRHAQAPVRAGTVGSGSSVAPVVPVWLSVAVAGQPTQPQDGVERWSWHTRAPPEQS